MLMIDTIGNICSSLDQHLNSSMLAEHLSDTLEGELLHQVDNIGLAQELVAEVLDSDWECCRVQQDLPILRQEAYKLLNDWLKLW